MKENYNEVKGEGAVELDGVYEWEKGNIRDMRRPLTLSRPPWMVWF